MSEFESRIAPQIECPVCVNYMFPPIRQCVMGHSFCTYCYNRVKSCPQCRAPKSVARNYVLENIQGHLTLPCKYASDGCRYIAKGADFDHHEYFCDYTVKLCTLRMTNECQWQGRTKDMEEHCMQSHPLSIYFEHRQAFVCSRFGAEFYSRRYYMLFSVFNKLFRCSWDLNDTTGFLKFAVYYLGKPLRTNRYSYKISIFRGDTNVVAMDQKAPCLYLRDEVQRFQGHFYVTMNYDMVRQFCNEAGDLKYAVQIIDNVLFKDLCKIYKEY